MDRIEIAICVAVLFQILAGWLFYQAGWHHGRASAYADATETNRKITKIITG